MDQLLFVTLFILQFVGHRVGDYLIQTDMQATNKTKSVMYLTRHCMTYSLIIALFTLIVLPLHLAVIVMCLTFIEHFIIDTRKPVFAWKSFIEKIAGNQTYQQSNLPAFVLIEMDQSIHYLRIFIISLLISYI